MAPPPVEAGLRLIAAATALLVLAVWQGEAIVAAYLPLFRWELALADGNFRILALEFARIGADSAIRVVAAPGEVVMIGERVLPLAAHSRFTVSTLAGQVLQPLVVFIVVLAAWPPRRHAEYPWRAALGAPLLVLLPLLDVPLILVAELHSTLLELAASRATAPIVAWKHFLEGGGRHVLAIVAAAAVVAGAATVARRRARPNSRR